MKFKKVDKEAKLMKVKETDTLIFYANETVRILPNQVAAIPTGIYLSELDNELLHVELGEYMILNRPFQLAKTLYHVLDEKEEIKIYLLNTGSRAAIIDKGETIAVGIKIKQPSTNTNTGVNTNKENK